MSRRGLTVAVVLMLLGLGVGGFVTQRVLDRGEPSVLPPQVCLKDYKPPTPEELRARDLALFRTGEEFDPSKHDPAQLYAKKTGLMPVAFSTGEQRGYVRMEELHAPPFRPGAQSDNTLDVVDRCGIKIGELGDQGFERTTE